MALQALARVVEQRLSIEVAAHNEAVALEAMKGPRRRIASLYRDHASPEHAVLHHVCELLLDHDEAFALWRSRHVLMVERQIGGKTGTGGSTGAQYLRGTLDKRFFPALWEVRSEL